MLDATKPTMSPRTTRRTVFLGLLLLLTVLGSLLVLTIIGDEPGYSDLEDRFGMTSESTPAPRPAPQMVPGEGPGARLERLGLTPEPRVNQQRLPTPTIDLSSPPQWTEPLALPEADPTPPDPYTEPPMVVDPHKRSIPETPRRRID